MIAGKLNLKKGQGYTIEMEEKNYSGIIPENLTGKIIDTVKSVELKELDEAKRVYNSGRRRLLDVNAWHDITGLGTAKFKLIDSSGNEVQRLVQKGDFFKIDIPGPGSLSGDGYDWVKVEDIREVSEGSVESIGIRVRPVANPESPDESTAHFYDEDSTSNFTITREGNKITAGIYDRNSKPNENSNSLADKARDLTVGLGAVTAFSAYQWSRFANALLQPAESAEVLEETYETDSQSVTTFVTIATISVVALLFTTYYILKKENALEAFRKRMHK